MRKVAVIMYGPPGAGKGTQANLLAKKYDLIHFNTGEIMNSVVHDPARQKEAVIQRERKLFDAGKLMTPSFVFREVARETNKIAKAKLGIIFSGSPRTMYEASKLIPILEKLYGKKNIYVFELVLSPSESIARNSKRMWCSICGYTLLSQYYPSSRPKHCPVCGGPFYKRKDDNAKVISNRLKEYKDRTEPIFGFLKDRGYKLNIIDASPAPYKIFLKLQNDYFKNAR
jgi:adenylate kinase